MNKVDVFDFGFGYELILILMTGVFIVDAVSIVKSLKGGYEDIREYAQLCVKYFKILLTAFAAWFFLTVAFTYGYDSVTSAIHGVLGVMMIIDTVACLVVKLRYGRKKRKCDGNADQKDKRIS